MSPVSCAAARLNSVIRPFALTATTPLLMVATMFSIGNAATLGNWMVSGRLDQHPKLKIGLIESGAGWVPFAVEALEHQFDEMLPRFSKTLTRRPWQYFRDHFMCSFWFESVAPKLLLETIGEDNIMFETDFPHPTCLHPNPVDAVSQRVATLRPETQRKVMGENAAALYRL